MSGRAVSGAIKHTRKSGVLPRPRPVLKQLTIKGNEYARKVEESKKSSYQDGIPHPRGSSRVAAPPKVVTPEEFITKTIKEPKAVPDKFRTVDQEWKFKRSAVRREYLKTAVEREAVLKAKRDEKLGEKKEERVVTADDEFSEATRLTVQTMEDILNEPILVLPTPEEKELLRAKREANRLQLELEAKERRAIELLELYQKCDSYIITMDELESKLDEVFSNPKTSMFGSSLEEPHNIGAVRNEFANSMLGLTREKKPGYDEVIDALEGKTEQWIQIAEKNAIVNSEFHQPIEDSTSNTNPSS